MPTKILLSAAILSLFPALSSAEPLTFGGQFRYRYENRTPTSFTNALGTDFSLLRTRISAKGSPAEGMRAFVEFQDSRTSGGSTVGANTGNVDLYQGYLDVDALFALPVDLRVGRFTMKYGSQRLVSNLGWSNVMRSWDGARLRTAHDDWSVDAWVTNIQENGTAKRDRLFSGLFATCKAVENHDFDVYLLSQEFGDGSQSNEAGTNTTGNLSEKTFGGRVAGKASALDYSFEAAFQFGRKAGDKIAANAAAFTAGYTFPVRATPRLGFEYSAASGDGDSTDGKEKTFNTPFSFGHFYHGYTDVWGWRNSNAWMTRLSVKPAKHWQVFADFHSYRLSQAKDSWYSAGKTALGTDATGNSGKNVGTELDLHAKTTVREKLKLWFGYSRFTPGAFAKATVGDQNIDWFFFQALVSF